jgi:hypothetical protein
MNAGGLLPQLLTPSLVGLPAIDWKPPWRGKQGVGDRSLPTRRKNALPPGSQLVATNMIGPQC